MKDFIFKKSALFIQNLIISLFNIIEYRKRYGGKYKYYFDKFQKNKSLSFIELKEIQKERYNIFLKNTLEKSLYYRQLYSSIDTNFSIEEIKKLPILKKEELRLNINNVFTIGKDKAVKSKTGGTTGKSLEVLFTYEDMQERFAMLDVFRSEFGYKLGEATAWFSGKNLLTQRDVKNKRFWKTDYLYNVRYYSTFHIKDEFLEYYIENLVNFKPKYIVGFPSSLLEIAKYGIEKGISFPKNVVISIFPTAETVTQEMREIIEKFFNSKIYNQYASSEGAPFIFECKNNNLHLELQSGVFEVLDINNEESNKGNLIVTSFTTNGTPLIRYNIGDEITLEDSSFKCNCGNNNPVVKEINGRIDDYVYSIENGKINLGNISNTLKDTSGIIKFQVIQNELEKIIIYLVVDPILYNSQIEKKFLQNWRDRVGTKMDIELDYKDEILVESSGKYRLVKNNIKNQIV